MTGGSGEFDNVEEFCGLVASESSVPIVVGVGVKTAADVANICRTPAVAAAVGSALVEHVAQGGSAGKFLRRMVADE
jgi:tryptophan synthase alpha subunit